MKTKSSIILIICAVLAFVSLTSCEKEQPQLASPQLSVYEMGSDWFTIVWQPVEGAVSYVCTGDAGAETTVTECSVTFSDLSVGTYTVKVKAVGDGYRDSETSEITVTLEDISLGMELDYAGEPGKFDIIFAPSANVAEIRYAVTSAVQQPLEDLLSSFAEGSLEGIETYALDGGNSTLSIARDSIGPYYVFAKGVTASGTESGVVSAQIMAASAGFTVDAYDLVAMDVTSTVYDDSQLYSGLLVVSKSVLQEIGMTIDELLEVYAMYGMVPYTDAGTSMTVALNGYENYDYIMGVVGFDADGMPASYGSFSFTSGFADESLPLPSPLTVEAYEVGSSEAAIRYTMGENTRAYYQMVIPLEEYNNLIEAGAGMDEYENPEDYVRDYAAVYGYTMFEDDDYVWTWLTPGTDYVALGFPMNGNGSLGYGEMALDEFTTSGTSSAAVSAAGVPVRNGQKVIRPLSAESVREFLSSVR